MNGITINIDPVIVQLGGFALRWYSLTFAGGIAVAILLTLRQAGRAGLSTEKVSDVALWAVVGGLVGARLFHVVDRLDYYLANPVEIVMVNHGGLAVWGGLITGGLVALFVAKKEGISTSKMADATVFGLLVGQMVGRIGCIINGDAYGGPTGMPWGFIYAHPDAFIPDSLRGISTHPYPVYEILWGATLLGGFLLLRRWTLRDGMLFMVYVAGYSLGRFSLTFVRQEAITLWGLQQAQVVALATLVLAVAGAVYLARTPPPAPAKATRKAVRRAKR